MLSISCVIPLKDLSATKPAGVTLRSVAMKVIIFTVTILLLFAVTLSVSLMLLAR